MQEYKLKKSADELIRMMKEEKGIAFDIMSESDAIEYLSKKNNYFRLASYRKNYDKYVGGENDGKYIRLDFGYLAELATIDMHLRFMIIKMCLDIEHSIKVQLLSEAVGNDSEDGYNIVRGFLNRYEWIVEDIYRKRDSAYVGDLIKTYFAFEVHISNSKRLIFDNYICRCPLWAFMEIIAFGELIKLYDFYDEMYPTSKKHFTGELNVVKSLRNACAHNNCIIHNLRKGYSKPSSKISRFISEISDISKDERKNKLTVRPLYEMTCLLYVYDNIVEKSIKVHRYSELFDMVNNRMIRHQNYFDNQQIICAAYSFLKKLVDFIC